MSTYNFRVVYNVKHVDKKSALYGLVSFDQSCKFGSLQSAVEFAKLMSNKKTKKIHVIGIPTIERL